MLGVLAKVLPPPEALRLSGVGIDISESSIKYVSLKSSGIGSDKLSLSHYGEIELPPNLISRGEINDVTTLAEYLAQVKKRTGMPYARISLPEERVYLFETEVDPKLKQKEIRQKLEFSLEENVPLSPRDAYFDFNLTDNILDNKNILSVVTVGAREVIDKYYEAFKLAGITPILFEAEAASIARSVLIPKDIGTKLLIDFGKDRTGLGIVHDGVLMYSSTIDMGGNNLISALENQLGDIDVSVFEILNDYGISGKFKGLNLAEVMLPVISSIKDEIQSRLHYWNNKNDSSRSVDEIVLCGGCANIRGLDRYFSDTLGLDTFLADVWINIFDTKKQAPEIGKRESYGYATSIGLALTSFIDK